MAHAVSSFVAKFGNFMVGSNFRTFGEQTKMRLQRKGTPAETGQSLPGIDYPMVNVFEPCDLDKNLLISHCHPVL